jgi:hypothetical protein
LVLRRRHRWGYDNEYCQQNVPHAAADHDTLNVFLRKRPPRGVVLFDTCLIELSALIQNLTAEETACRHQESYQYQQA